MDIVEIFNHEKPRFDGQPLYINDIELLTVQHQSTIGNEKLLFHGTPLHYIDDIIKNGFDMTKAGSHMSGHIGLGMYFSDLICQSIYYQLKEEYTGDEKYFKLLVCKVALGKSILLTRSIKTNNINLLDGYASHITTYSQDGKHGHEYCIFNSQQIVPYALLHLRC